MAIVPRKRANGQTSYQVKLAPPGHKAVTKTFSLRSQAEKFEREVKRSADLGTLDQFDSATRKITFKTAVREYSQKALPDLARGGATQRAHIERIASEFGPQFVSALRAPMINAWTDKLTAAELSGQTINHHLNTLSAVVEFSRRSLGVHVPENPVKLARRPKIAKARDRRLRPREFKYLVRAAKLSPNPDLHGFILLAIKTAMRLGELIAMRWDDVNLALKHSDGTLPGTISVRHSKNGHSRTVALFPPAAAILRARQHTGSQTAKVWRWADVHSFEKTWQRCKERARRLYADDHEGEVPCEFLNDLRFHDLRHEGTSRLFERGLNPFEVASLTGHLTIQMLSRYTHISEAKLLAKKRSI